MKLSVIILNYNVRYFLQPCIQSVQEAMKNINAEIIVADNDSSDDSCEMVQQEFPDVKLLPFKENHGFAKANNLAVQEAKGEYILILNPDTIVAHDTLDKILSYAEEKSNFGILGVRLIDGNGVFLPECKRGVPTAYVSMERLLGLKIRGKGKYYADHLKPHETGEVDILVGAFMLMKKNVYQEVGGFDEQYFMYGEDIDLSYKVLKAGYNNFYYSDTSTIHFKGESTTKDLKYLSHFTNAMKIFYKNHFKKNPISNFIMFSTIKVWYKIKRPGIKDVVQSAELPKNVLYIGKDEKLLASLKRKYTDVNFYQTDQVIAVASFVKEKDVQEVIFDNNVIDYGTIVDQINKYSGRITFKMRPAHSNYIFGSNSSQSKGVVITF